MERVSKTIPTTKVEKLNNDWGDCRVHWTEMITVEDVMYYVKKFLE